MLRFCGLSKFPFSISRRAIRQHQCHVERRNLMMDSFLRDAKKRLQSAPNKVSIVIGNESCDLDSMTSAILFAWFHADNKPESSSSGRYIPILNIPKEDIDLRPEFKTLLEICHIDIKNLITLTDLPEPSVLPPENTQWILVDHNKLDNKLGPIYSDRVQGCIDHHEEEHSVPTDIESEPRIIETCGSCTSLVLRELAPQILDMEINVDNDPRYTSDALKLGLASILSDTDHLRNQNKTKKIDAHIALHIDRILKGRSADWNRIAFFDTISAAEKNLDGLSFRDVLRKDYKQWRERDINLGISSVVRDLDFVDGLVNEGHDGKMDAEQYAVKVSEFMAERELDMFAIMTAFVNDDGKQGFQRQLRIHWRSEQAKEVFDKFERECSEDLQLELIANDKQSSGAELKWTSWQQNNLAASRKQVAPMLRTMIKEHLNE